MRDVFLDFEWPVAPGYQWQDWRDARGRPVTVSVQRLSRLEIPSAAVGPRIEAVWQQREAERTKVAAATGPVLCPVDAKKHARRYTPLRHHSALFQEFARLDYQDTAAILGFAGKYGALGLSARHQTTSVKGRSGRVRSVIQRTGNRTSTGRARSVTCERPCGFRIIRARRIASVD